MTRIWAALLVAVVTVGVAGGVAVADQQKITGTLLLQDGGFGQKGAPCEGNGGYDDLQAGAQVRVKNGDDKTIGIGTLGQGHNVVASSATPTFMYCEFRFSVKVPNDEDFYAIEVTHRGELTYSRKKLERAKWRVSFSLG